RPDGPSRPRSGSGHAGPRPVAPDVGRRRATAPPPVRDRPGGTVTTRTDVVITGLGATTPLGGDVPSTWQAALAGHSGARTLDNDWAATYEIAVSFAAQLVVPPAEVLTRPE